MFYRFQVITSIQVHFISGFLMDISQGYLTRKLLCENLHPVWGTMPQNVLLNFSRLTDGIPQRKNSL